MNDTEIRHQPPAISDIVADTVALSFNMISEAKLVSAESTRRALVAGQLLTRR